jgi:hypothetical protein
MSISESLEDVVTSGTLELSNAKTSNGKRVSSYIGKGTVLIMSVRNPYTMKIEERDRFVVWARRRSSNGTLSITFYDLNKYLAQSKVTMLYSQGKRSRPWTAAEITRDLGKRYGIPISRIPGNCRAKIPYFYQENEPLLDALIRLWTLESKASGRNFILKMVRGRLQIVTKAKKPPARVVELLNSKYDSGVVSSVEASDSLDNTATVVRLWGVAGSFADGTSDTRRASVKSDQMASKAGVAQWGRIYFEESVEGVVTKAAINKRARTLLNLKSRPSYSTSVTVVGMPWLKAGTPIYLRDDEVGVSGMYWFKSITHTLSGAGDFTSQGELSRYDYTKKLAADPADLKPDSENTDSTSSKSGVSSMQKKTAMPNDVWNAIRAASVKAGAPQSWANSKALEKLIQHESGFRWTAQNPSSTAYGLFQFLDSTWGDWDTGVTKRQASPGYENSKGQTSVKVNGVGWVQLWKYNMCVAGLKYIKKKYGTPEQAWAFWQEKKWY